MNIAIIGTGNVGLALAKVLATKEHEIFLGSRDAVKVSRIAGDMGVNVSGGTYDEAAAFGDIIILAVPWGAAQQVIEELGDIKGKILIDCINPLLPKLGGLAVGYTTSAAEQIAKWAKGAKVIKAFNSIGAQNFDNTQFEEQKASGFICGDDLEAKKIVSEIVEEVGFDVVDTGSLMMARLLEPLAMLWIDLAYVQGLGPDIAFKLLKR